MTPPSGRQPVIAPDGSYTFTSFSSRLTPTPPDPAALIAQAAAAVSRATHLCLHLQNNPALPRFLPLPPNSIIACAPCASALTRLNPPRPHARCQTSPTHKDAPAHEFHVFSPETRTNVAFVLCAPCRVAYTVNTTNNDQENDHVRTH